MNTAYKYASNEHVNNTMNRVKKIKSKHRCSALLTRVQKHDRKKLMCPNNSLTNSQRLYSIF